jgi:hypothetical protein
MSSDAPLTTTRVVRGIFATATFVFLGAALLVGDDPRLYAASAAFGTIWWVWDLLEEHVFRPVGLWITRRLLGGGIGAAPSNLRPDLDETIRLLESHLTRGASRRVDLNAAIRLEEIYRLVKRDPVRARRVIEIVRARYPDAPELKRYDKGRAATGEG